MDSDEEEEVLLVELSGLPSPDTIKTCQGTCTILGIDSDEPVIQVDNYVFKGRYEDILGTAMIFQQDKGRRLKYVCKTVKKLTMQRVLLRKKNEDPPPPASPSPHRTATAGGCDGAGASSDVTIAPSLVEDMELGHVQMTIVSGDGPGGTQCPIPIPPTVSDGVNASNVTTPMGQGHT